ncbi:MAG: hypothetical protein NZ531_00625 [Aquificaceae bacterium]|nr:hypothetical protein [Aquificaceae bacterium]
MIIRRFRAGDKDLMLKVYGPNGLMKLFVPDGLLPEEGFLGFTEPFNLLHAVYRQSGDTVILRDILKVEFFSYLSIKSYSAYLWMASVMGFVERWFFQYDPELFDTVLRYLSLVPNNQNVLLLRFKLEFLRSMGLYKEEVFTESLRPIVRRILGEDSYKGLERLRVSRGLLLKLDNAIESHLSASL